MLRFDRPPVRRTRLSLRLSHERPLRISHISRLFDQWHEVYVTVEEGAPDADAMERMEWEPGASAWPLPAMRFINAAGTEAICVQNGRFDIEWTFPDATGEGSYPGYAVLENELSTRFEEFRNALRVHGFDVSLVGSECRYENPLVGYAPGEAAVGLLTGWTGGPAGHLPEQGYVGVRLHACADPERHSCTSYIALDGDTNEVPVLSISVIRDDEGGDAALGGLSEAHDELIDLFWSFTSSEQRNDWGVQG